MRARCARARICAVSGAWPSAAVAAARSAAVAAVVGCPASSSAPARRHQAHPARCGQPRPSQVLAAACHASGSLDPARRVCSASQAARLPGIAATYGWSVNGTPRIRSSVEVSSSLAAVCAARAASRCSWLPSTRRRTAGRAARTVQSAAPPLRPALRASLHCRRRQSGAGDSGRSLEASIREPGRRGAGIRYPAAGPPEAAWLTVVACGAFPGGAWSPRLRLRS